METDISDKSKLETVKVVVRCRPMSEKEKSAGYHNVVRLYPATGTIELQQSPKSTPKSFTFDAVYDCGRQQDIFFEVFRPLVDSVLKGFNGTVFAYGMTGAGKTYTMEGVLNDPEEEGVIPNSFKHIFNYIARSENTQFLVSASYLEIYEESVRDLLSPDQKRKLDVRENYDAGVYVKDLTVSVCKTIEDLNKLMVDGKKNRSVGTTNMNAHSSRSHAIFIISIESCEKTEGSQHVKIGKLNLVDLAGSERSSKTGATGSTLKESIKINLSLSALGNVISALVDGKSSHVPYRDSKLTRLLQDSLGGNAKTVMIANIGPASDNFDETMTTLRYASRAKCIKNKPKVNIDPKDAILLKYKEEINSLKAKLALKEAKRKKKTHKKGVVCENEVIESTNEVDIVSKMEHLLMEERVTFLNEQNVISEERQKILDHIKAKDEELRLENEAKEKIENQLKELEAKLLCGGKNIIDHTNEQQRILEKRRSELAEQTIIEREINQKLIEEEYNTSTTKETYFNLQQEAEIKTKKLKKLFQRLQALKEDINDEEEINSFERQEKERAMEALTRDIKLSNLVIDNFVGPEEKAKFLEGVTFDEEEDCWNLSLCFSQSSFPHFNSADRPVSANQHRRPMTSHALKMTRMTAKPRYKSENIAVLDLSLPRKRTVDHEPRSIVDPYVKEAIEEVIADEVYCVNMSNLKKLNTRSGQRSSYQEQMPSESRPRQASEYPVPRGLVPKTKSCKMKTVLCKM